MPDGNTNNDKGKLEQSNPKQSPFVPENLDRTVIAIPLLKDLKAEDEGTEEPKSHAVIIDLNLEFPGGRNGAREWVKQAARELIATPAPNEPDDQYFNDDDVTPQYVFGTLRARTIRGLVARDAAEHDSAGADFKRRAIFHIWPDFEIFPLTNKSISTVKADAARASFAALGEGIVWAVMDSGIQSDHPHFVTHANL